MDCSQNETLIRVWAQFAMLLATHQQQPFVMLRSGWDERSLSSAMAFREHHYYTYIMASSSGTLYVGMTNCIEARSRQHREGRGSEFTRRYRVDRLVYYECFRYVLNAIRREKEIKGWTRAKKEALIRSINPEWKDLSREFAKVYKPSPGVSVRVIQRDASSHPLLSMTKKEKPS